MVHCQENFVYVNLCTIRQWCRNIGLSKFPFHYKWVRWYYYDNVTDDGIIMIMLPMMVMMLMIIGNITMKLKLMQTIAMDERELVMYNNIFPKLQVKCIFLLLFHVFSWHYIRAYKTTSLQNYRLSDFVYVHQKMSNTSQDETFLKSTSCLNWKQNLCFSAKYLWGWSYLPSENSQSGFP